MCECVRVCVCVCVCVHYLTSCGQCFLLMIRKHRTAVITLNEQKKLRAKHASMCVHVFVCEM